MDKLSSEAFSHLMQEWLPECEERARHYFGLESLPVDTKADDTPVTRADREIEAFLRAQIHDRYPDHGIIGEEEGESSGESDYQWVIDPIDGTKSFISGCPLFGILVGLLHRGTPTHGVISLPALQHRIWGNGSQSFTDQGAVGAAPPVPIEKATLLISDPRLVAAHHPHSRFEELWNRAAIARTWGDCYGYYLVATGKAHAMLDPVLSPWDLLPLLPVLKGAGIAVSDWAGNDPTNGNSLVAAHPEVLPAILPFLLPS